MSVLERKIKIIHNPVAGQRSRKRLAVALKALKEHASKVKVTPTRCAGDGTKRALKTLTKKKKKPFEIIAAAGGDGTIAEVANGMRGYDVPLLILPLGTANVMAREIGLGTSMRKIANNIEKLNIQTVHPGIMGDKRFVQMVGAGFDSLAVASLETSLKRRIGAAAYVVAAFKAVKRMKSLNMRVTIDGETYETASVIVTNGRLYGGPFVIAPDADLTKPEFKIIMMNSPGFWAALKYGLMLPINKLHTLKSVTVKTGTHVKIESDIALPIQADGDYVGLAPIEMKVDEMPLNILAPGPEKRTYYQHQTVEPEDLPAPALETVSNL